MIILYILTALALLISLIANRQKTIAALRVASKLLTRILPAFTGMLVSVSILLFFIPDSLIAQQLQGSGTIADVLLAAGLGSIIIMPGFIAFPLCGILLSKGVPYMALAAFSSTLMMVGIVTFPIEQHFFGTKFALIRNVVSLLIALCIALVIGLFFGEIN